MLIFQIGHLQLSPISGQEVGEIAAIPDEELAELDKEAIQYEITVLEEKLAQMKPNMAAIAEYRKKVTKKIGILSKHIHIKLQKRKCFLSYW